MAERDEDSLEDLEGNAGEIQIGDVKIGCQKYINLTYLVGFDVIL